MGGGKERLSGVGRRACDKVCTSADIHTCPPPGPRPRAGNLCCRCGKKKEGAAGAPTAAPGAATSDDATPSTPVTATPAATTPAAPATPAADTPAAPAAANTSTTPAPATPVAEASAPAPPAAPLEPAFGVYYFASTRGERWRLLGAGRRVRGIDGAGRAATSGAPGVPASGRASPLHPSTLGQTRPFAPPPPAAAVMIRREEVNVNDTLRAALGNEVLLQNLRQTTGLSVKALYIMHLGSGPWAFAALPQRYERVAGALPPTPSCRCSCYVARVAAVGGLVAAAHGVGAHTLLWLAPARPPTPILKPPHPPPTPPQRTTAAAPLWPPAPPAPTRASCWASSWAASVQP